MSALSQPIPIGSEVRGEYDTYEVKTKPKSGAFAQVYEVEARGDGKRYILKLNEVNVGPRESEILRRASEALECSNCRARVVSVIDQLVEPKVKGFTGHIEEKALGSSIEEHQPSEQQALRIAIDFAEALQACSQKNIAYLDIKPEKHIFWIAEPWQVTIIDWNVAKLDATSRELRDDLLTYCRELPAVFRGKSQGDSRNRLHPLSWNLEAQQDQLGINLGYAVWKLLARASVTPGGPLIPAVANLIRVQKEYEFKQWEMGAGIAESICGLVSVAWQSILEELRRVGDLWIVANRVGVVGSPKFADVKTLEQASIASLDRWPEWCAAARKNASDHIEGSRAQRSSLIAGVKYHGDQLGKARLLDPQNATAVVALGAYNLWSQLDLRNFDTTWKDLVELALDQEPSMLRSILEEYKEQLALEIVQRCREIDEKDGSSDPERSLGTVWSRVYDDFFRETIAWTYLEEARNVPQPEARIGLLKLAQESVPYHPLVLSELKIAEDAIDRQRRVDNAKKSIDSALANSNVQEAERAFRDLKLDASTDPQAKAYVDKYEQDLARLAILQTLTTTLPDSLASWNKTEINRVHVDLLKIPPSEARDLFVTQATRQLKLIDDLSRDVWRWRESFNQQESSIQAFGGSSNMRSSAHELRRMDSIYVGAPQLEGLWQDWKVAWREHITWLLFESKKIIARNTNAGNVDTIINESKAILDEFAVVRQLQEEYITNGLPTVVEIGKDVKQEEERLKQSLEKTRTLLADIEREFLLLLDDPSVLSGKIEARFSTLPASLQNQHRQLLIDRQILDLSRKIQQLLVVEDLEAATNCLQTLKSPNASPETIRDLNRRIEDKRNVLKVRHLSSRISDADWLAQTKAFLESFDTQLIDVRSSELREALDGLRTQYTQVEGQVSLANHLRSLDQHLEELMGQQNLGFDNLSKSQQRQQDLWDRERDAQKRITGQFRALAMILTITTWAILLGVAFAVFGQIGASVAGLAFLIVMGLFVLGEFNRRGSHRSDLSENSAILMMSDIAPEDTQTQEMSSVTEDESPPSSQNEVATNTETEKGGSRRDRLEEDSTRRSKRKLLPIISAVAILLVIMSLVTYALMTGFDFGGLLPSTNEGRVSEGAVVVLPASTPSPTLTYMPSATPSPTATSTSTSTPMPTSSPSPVPPPLAWEAGTQVGMRESRGEVKQDADMNLTKWQYVPIDATGGTAVTPSLTVVSMPDQKRAEVATAFFAFGQAFDNTQLTLASETPLYAGIDDGYIQVAVLKIPEDVTSDNFILYVEDETLGPGFEFGLSGWVWADAVTPIQQ